MRTLKLYVKTSLLASLITVLMFVLALTFLSARIAALIQGKEKDLARIQAAELAEQIESFGLNERDSERLRQSANLIQSGRPNVTAVRIWQTDSNAPAGSGEFTELASSDDSFAAQSVAENNRAALQNNQTTETEIRQDDKTVFRVFAPLREANGKVFGAVEVAQTLDSPWTIAAGYAQSQLGLAIAAVFLITLATYLLFRYLVYRPIELLMYAMRRAEAGDLDARAPVFADDELGKVAARFNRMVAALNEMTNERKAYQETLQTRVHEATEELQQKNEQLADANRELWQMSRRLSETERLAAAGQTAAQFAHEVGTPLNLISGHVQLLRLKSENENDGDDDGDGNANGNGGNKERLDIISAQIERIERIVRSMLDRTKLAKRQRVMLDLNEVLQRTFDATAPMFDEKRVHLAKNLAGNLPPVSGDADHLQQVFINLINNALDAMPTATGGELKIETSREENQAIVDFADDGAGMDDETRAKIFDVLYTTKGARGTGLGLVVVKQIMQEHDGEIEVESAVGKGTRFRLRFPLASSDTTSPR